MQKLLPLLLLLYACGPNIAPHETTSELQDSSLLKTEQDSLPQAVVVEEKPEIVTFDSLSWSQGFWMDKAAFEEMKKSGKAAQLLHAPIINMRYGNCVGWNLPDACCLSFETKKKQSDLGYWMPQDTTAENIFDLLTHNAPKNAQLYIRMERLKGEKELVFTTIEKNEQREKRYIPYRKGALLDGNYSVLMLSNNKTQEAFFDGEESCSWEKFVHYDLALDNEDRTILIISRVQPYLKARDYGYDFNEDYPLFKNTEFYILVPNGPDAFSAYSIANSFEVQEDGRPIWEVVHALGAPSFYPPVKKGKAVFTLEKK